MYNANEFLFNISIEYLSSFIETILTIKFYITYIINSILPIVSISLNDDIINDIDKLQKNLGFTGRSEIVRAGLRNIIAEQKDRDTLQGKLAALLLIIHQERDDDQVTNMRHDFEEIVTTHIHSKIDQDRCVELFLLKGEAELIRNMTKKFQTNKKLEHVKLITM